MELHEEWIVNNTFNVTDLFQYFREEPLYYSSKFEDKFPERKAELDTAVSDLLKVPFWRKWE